METKIKEAVTDGITKLDGAESDDEDTEIYGDGLAHDLHSGSHDAAGLPGSHAGHPVPASGVQ